MCPNQKPAISLVYKYDLMRTALANLFMNDGWVVDYFDTAQDFFASAVDDPPKCVILGVHSLDLEDFDFVERILDQTAKSAIVTVTVTTKVARLLRAESKGKFEVVEVPVEPQILLDTVRRVCRQGQHDTRY